MIRACWSKPRCSDLEWGYVNMDAYCPPPVLPTVSENSYILGNFAFTRHLGKRCCQLPRRLSNRRVYLNFSAFGEFFSPHKELFSVRHGTNQLVVEAQRVFWGMARINCLQPAARTRFFVIHIVLDKIITDVSEEKTMPRISLIKTGYNAVFNKQWLSVIISYLNTVTT
jgi:hypothetical protein